MEAAIVQGRTYAVKEMSIRDSPGRIGVEWIRELSSSYFEPCQWLKRSQLSS